MTCPFGFAWPPAFSSHLCVLSDPELVELEHALAFPDMSASSFALRRAGHAVTGIVPDTVHKILTSTAKLLRRLFSADVGYRDPDAPLAQIAPGKRLWSGRRATVVLTHDLDTPECVTGLNAILSAEAERGLRSVVHVLTGGKYPIKSGWLQELVQRGVEIGLHGLTHDYAIGGRRPEVIRSHLLRAIDALEPIRPHFYRAPAFAVSSRLASEVASLGFRCDSSRTVYHPSYRSSRVLLPFRPLAPGSNLCELPVAIEDSWLFRDWQLDERAAASYCDKVLERALQSGGVVVVDTHPSILAKFPTFYPALLDRWLAQSDVWIAPPNALLDCFEALCVA